MNLAQLFRHETELLALAAGQALFTEGEQGEFMYVLMSGIAEISVHNRLVETSEPGAVFGEMSMIEGGLRSATVTAKTDCQLLAINQKRFLFLIQQTPNFSLHIMRVIADRLRRTDAFL